MIKFSHVRQVFQQLNQLVIIKHPHLELLIFVVGQLQLLSLSQDLNQFLEKDVDTYFNLLNLFYCLQSILRPQKLLSNSKEFTKYCFLIPLFFIFFIFLSVIIFLFRTAIFQKQTATKTQSIFFTSMSIFLQIYPYIFYVPLTEILAISLVHNIQDSLNITNVVIIAILILILISFNIIIIRLNESNSFPSPILKLEFLGNSNIWEQIILYAFLLLLQIKTNWSFYISICLCFLQQFAQISNIGQVFQIYKLYPQLLISTMNFVFTFQILISYVANNSYLQISFSVFLWPLIYFFSLLKFTELKKLNLGKNRSFNQIYNNLILLFYHNSKQITLNQIHLIVFRIQQIGHYDDLYNGEQKHNNQSFIQELKLFNTEIIKSHSKTDRWHLRYMKYILIHKRLMLFNKCCQLIDNIKQGYLFNENTKEYIKISIKLSASEDFFLNYNLQDTLSSIVLNIRVGNLKFESELINNYIQYKKILEGFEEGFVVILREKIKLFHLLKGNTSIIKENYLFDGFYEYSENVSKFELSLQDFFAKYNTVDIKQVLLLLYAEIYNNYLKAILLHQNQTSSSNFTFQSQDSMEFCVMQIRNNLEQIKLLKMSSKMLVLLKYDQKQHELPTINLLLPDEFLDLHLKKIQQFLKTGKSKFFQRFSQIFIRGKNDEYVFFEMQLYNQLNPKNGLVFYGFFQYIIDQPLCLIINQQKIIIGYTKSLTKYLIPCQIYISIYLHQSITSLMPNFDDVNIEDINEEEETFEIQQNFINDQIAEVKIIKRQNLFLVMIHNIKFKQEQEFQVNIGETYIDLPLSSEGSIMKPYQFEQDQKNQKNHQNYHKIVNNSHFIISKKNQIKLNNKKINKNNQITHLTTNQELDQFKTIQSPICTERNNFLKLNQIQSQQNINEDKNDVQPQQMELQSSQFSRNFLDNSIYFKKYKKMNHYIDKNRFSKYYDLMILCLLLLFATNITNYLIQQSNLIPQLQLAGKNLDLVAIKSYFITPSQNCFTSQACVVNYIILGEIYKVIPKEVQWAHMEFSALAIEQTYQYFRESFINQLNNPNLLEFLIGEEIEVKMLSYDHFYKVNVTLRNGLFYYLNAQFRVTNQDFYHLLAKPSSKGDFAYFVTNLQGLNEKFQSISDDILAYIVDKSGVTQRFWTTLMLKLILTQSLFLFLAYQFYLKYQFIIQMQFDLIVQTNYQCINQEIQKLENIDKNFEKKQILKSYKFDIKEKELELTQKFQEFSNLGRTNEEQLTLHKYVIKKRIAQLMFCIVFALMFLPSFLLNSQTNTFFAKYSSSALFLKELSTASSAVSAVYQLKEVNYMITPKLKFFFFYNDTDRIELNKGLLKELEYIKDFSQSLNAFGNDSQLVNAQFTNLLNEMKKSNLCDFLVTFSIELAQPHCDIIYNGVLKIGLVNTITEIYNRVSQEYIDSYGFQSSKRTALGTFEDMEIGIITSDAVLRLKQSYYECLLSITNELINQITIIIIVCIIVDCIFILMILCLIRPRAIQQFGIIKNFIQLIPPQTLYLDQQFDRSFRFLIMKYNL